jgi:ribosomal protein L37E
MRKMDVNYVAGFFDGEGCLCLYKQHVGAKVAEINIAQKEPEALYEIRDFLESRGIHSSISFRIEETIKAPVKPSYSHHLRIRRKDDVRKFCLLIEPCIIVKKRAVVALLNDPWLSSPPTYGHVKKKIIGECRRCNSSDLIAGGMYVGKQLYKCRSCGMRSYRFATKPDPLSYSIGTLPIITVTEA